MTRTDRLRRVLLLCCHFTRYHAYLKAGRRGRHPRLKTPFWSSVDSNFYDLCVLEWCKLLGDVNDPHYWGKVVSDPVAFELELRGRAVIAASTFEQYIKAMRRYRNKFVAHLDSDRVALLPNLEIARSTVTIYYAHVLLKEAKKVTAKTFPRDLESFHSDCYYEALDVYQYQQVPT